MNNNDDFNDTETPKICYDCNEYNEIDVYTKYLIDGYMRKIGKLGKYKVLNMDLECINYICMQYLFNNDIEFISFKSSNFMHLLSLNGFYYGKHEWTIKVLKCDVYKQEIGVISKYNETMKIHQNGICSTASFRARAVFGNVLCII